jgi:hypothetical protein
MTDVKKKGVFGRVVAFMQVIEFQKRGLPHAHILLILSPEDRYRTVDAIDSAVRAELPESAELRGSVCKLMLHNQCSGPGSVPNAQCIQEDGRCKRRFPQPFADHTHWNDEETHPLYRRRSQIVAVEKRFTTVAMSTISGSCLTIRSCCASTSVT